MFGDQTVFLGCWFMKIKWFFLKNCLFVLSMNDLHTNLISSSAYRKCTSTIWTQNESSPFPSLRANIHHDAGCSSFFLMAKIKILHLSTQTSKLSLLRRIEDSKILTRNSALHWDWNKKKKYEWKHRLCMIVSVENAIRWWKKINNLIE